CGGGLVMNETEILVIDFNRTEDLGTQLISTLQSNSRFEVNALQATDYKLDSFKDCVPATATGNSPSLIFLVLASNTLERTAEMVDSMETYFQQIPIIVVTQAAESTAMIDLLKKGVADFVTPPIREIDIIPRIWRLLAQNMPEP